MSVTRVSQECYRSVTRALKECYKSVIPCNCFAATSLLCAGRIVTRVLQEYYKSVTSVVQECYKCVTSVLQECYKCVVAYPLFQWVALSIVPILSHSAPKDSKECAYACVSVGT
jgi:hypothetical protein